MPDEINLYENAKIYRIVSFSTGKQYIGSTYQSLSDRMSAHRSKYVQFQAGKYHYLTSFEVLGHGDAEIYLVEDVICNNRNELHKREGEIIETTDCVNKVIPGSNGVCQHNNLRSRCVPCGGTTICDHGQRKSRCKDCGGVSSQVVVCECGVRIIRENLPKHRKTEYHRLMLPV